MLPATLRLDAYRPFRRDVEAQRPAMDGKKIGIEDCEMLAIGTPTAWPAGLFVGHSEPSD